MPSPSGRSSTASQASHDPALQDAARAAVSRAVLGGVGRHVGGVTVSGLITIRAPWLLRVFGWGTYDGKPRTTYPRYVTAHWRLWLFWLAAFQKAQQPFGRKIRPWPLNLGPVPLAQANELRWGGFLSDSQAGSGGQNFPFGGPRFKPPFLGPGVLKTGGPSPLFPPKKRGKHPATPPGKNPPRVFFPPVGGPKKKPPCFFFSFYRGGGEKLLGGGGFLPPPGGGSLPPPPLLGENK